ncbi:exopolyphosphatase / guanosine-5'-triphosphate,3'-diphosphate pyrophosphatase [Geodermatophilus dictyosporus]|uniref:Exopolyphosphatase / guanosine-5'-triphosphate,3'-diphosphate pyrophosphatase n=1 Tax=Geodermatophilus dictyosporus TaxID=1523247 RepID=A0A1I5NNW0_9ACTN|nr:Ppx/GppA phosphatase family protein [Geodermatophilus dictyosporus]SFP22921.1 exopolyphosphatase / guanosine-5'-triphosphate,3'-diphosphate pyrophosphatase [Geodermatophilus dictyosporus]
MTRVAAVDCGTNSIRLLVADVPPEGAHTDLLRRMEVVRLGQGVDATCRLAPEAIERTRRVLAGYAAQARELGATAVRMVATSATRDAANRADFEAMVTATLGQPPDVVPGDEEARLSFLGATASLDAAAAAHGGAPPRPPYLVVDIGGGSTEFVLGDAGGVRAARSVDVGCVRLTERHLHGDPPTADEIQRAESDVRAALAEVAAAVPVQEAATLVGLAGSVTTVAALALRLPAYDPVAIHGSRIGVGAVRSVTAGLLTATRERRAAYPVMHPGRVDVIGAGALVLRVLMDAFSLDEVVVSEHDILDGIALRLARG